MKKKSMLKPTHSLLDSESKIFYSYASKIKDKFKIAIKKILRRNGWKAMALLSSDNIYFL